jgi:peptidoglycan/xylan/chitin deacetylase (PgdA/CDA1 family)
MQSTVVAQAEREDGQSVSPARAVRKKIPDRLVVLTFDDSSKSHFTVVRPLLKQYGFGATFFITEGFDFPDNKRDYMAWDEIARLHADGFEIGNHTRDHVGITDQTVDQLDAQLRGIEKRCEEHGIPAPITFAWPGNAMTQNAFPILRAHGIRFARRGGAPEYPYEQGRGFAYQPGADHPLILPSAGDARPDWTLDDFILAVQQARQGGVAILQFHGTPDTAHAWVNTPRQNFAAFLKYLAVNDYQVVALRNLEAYVDPDVSPINPLDIVNKRKQLLAANAAANDE